MTHEKVKVLVETAERSFRGTIHKPVIDDRFRLSDHLNTYDRNFICLSDVTINDRGQQYRAGEKCEFVAVSIAAVTYITQIEA
jgi:hypothetical protein